MFFFYVWTNDWTIFTLSHQTFLPSFRRVVWLWPPSFDLWAEVRSRENWPSTPWSLPTLREWSPRTPTSSPYVCVYTSTDIRCFGFRCRPYSVLYCQLPSLHFAECLRVQVCLLVPVNVENLVKREATIPHIITHTSGRGNKSRVWFYFSFVLKYYHFFSPSFRAIFLMILCTCKFAVQAQRHIHPYFALAFLSDCLGDRIWADKVIL